MSQLTRKTKTKKCWCGVTITPGSGRSQNCSDRCSEQMQKWLNRIESELRPVIRRIIRTAITRTTQSRSVKRRS
jgi:hypothetical protein